MRGRHLSLRITEELHLRMVAAMKRMKVESVTEFVTRALEHEVAGSRRVEEMRPKVTEETKRETLEAAKGLQDLLQDAIMARMRTDREFLNGLTNTEFAKLVASRLPKESVQDPEAERDVLSLEEWLGTLPGEADVTEELNRAKLELARVTTERDANLALLRRKDEGGELAQFMEAVYRLMAGYVNEYVTRNEFPGVGDGGGISESGLAAIARRVSSDLARLKLDRTGVKGDD